MKVELTMPLIKRLTLDQRPTGVDAHGNLVFAANPSKKDYIVYDANQEAPPGFGVKIARKKTFIIRRKIHGKSIMPTVGNVADFMADGGKAPLTLARSKAAAMALEMVETGQNPNESARKAVAAEVTLEAVFKAYREHMRTRTVKPASAETVRVIDRAINKFKPWGWLTRKVKEITAEEVKAKFLVGRDIYPVANEQAFRWASAAIAWHMGTEALNAAAANRSPMLKANPFTILVIDKMYPTMQQKETIYKEGKKRNPLSPKKTLGPFLEAAWSKGQTNDNLTGVHFLIAMLLWGCRKSEHAQCQWGELLDADQKKVTSHVAFGDDEYGDHVFFYGTKGGKNHRLPIGPMSVGLLRLRQTAAKDEALKRGFASHSRSYVFPARNKFSKTGHYINPDELRHAIMEEAGIERLTNHDLRRTFGALMTSLQVPEVIKGTFFNHAHATVSDRYTEAEWDELRSWMTKIEQAILLTAPNVYNALKPTHWPPIAAPEPHVCKPQKPRTGRPKKTTASSTVAV
ncbi:MULTISPECIES: tyrosine-type recombinase/integrase [unclassified Duganella]|uniref:tyrosine-type recombinase/integrase n=1 Tax=unclassified Duganella TaxID=2636909 RepID=UPI0008863547|nr:MULTISPECIES: tyrosine-type recombinase/integrase [unclassified Duganella]SDG06447.1 Phage integrase family protein [Duganella sp. OV458]SDI98756.1 Phage integrase family protein [Duganella sp. OV510]